MTLTLDVFGAESHRITHWFEWCMFSLSESVFRPLLCISAKTFPDSVRDWLGAKVVPIVRISLSYPSENSKSQPLSNLICLWLPRFWTIWVSDRSIRDCGFYNCFGCSNLTWIRCYSKFGKPHFYWFNNGAESP